MIYQTMRLHGIVLFGLILLAHTTLVIAQTNSAGRWQEKSMLLWDEQHREIVSRTLSVWNSNPDKELEFSWQPLAGEGVQESGRINGKGTLSWRRQGTPAYDTEAVYSRYVGSVTEGRPHGVGTMIWKSGARYQGEWMHGNMNGRGTMEYANGDTFYGTFVKDQPHGKGRYETRFGETYIGEFKDGLRHGRGRVRFASGEWETTEWFEGRETAVSRLERTVQFRSRDTKTIRVGVTTDRANNANYKARFPGATTYEHRRSRRGFEIRPDNEKLRRQWKDPNFIIESSKRSFSNDDEDFFQVNEMRKDTQSRYNSVEEWPYDPRVENPIGPAYLILSVSNQSSRTISIVDGYVEVESSKTDFQPYITIDYDYDIDKPIKFSNHGWGKVLRPSLEYDFSRKLASPARAKRFAALEQISDFTDSNEVLIYRGAKELGLDIERIRQKSYTCSSIRRLPSCLKRIVRGPEFGSFRSRIRDWVINNNYVSSLGLDTTMIGRLKFSWRDADNQLHDHAILLRNIYTLAFIQVPDMAEKSDYGGIARPYDNRRPWKLRLDERNYRIPFTFKRKLRRSESLRVAFTLTADKSSNHRFRVALNLADKTKIMSENIDLQYFVPRKLQIN